MALFICKFCGGEKNSKPSLIGHETCCKHNPNHKVRNLENARQKAVSLKFNCKWCDTPYVKANIIRHEASCIKNPEIIAKKTKTCPVCDKKFLGTSATCSHSCSNTHFRHGRKGGTQFIEDDILFEKKMYRQLCFRYHQKKCVICGEDKVVAVHHLNGKRDDNRPENLIPLCPTHHQYCHSSYKYMVEKQIDEYISTWMATRNKTSGVFPDLDH